MLISLYTANAHNKFKFCLPILLFLFAISGCAGAHLKNDQNAALANKTVASLEEVDTSKLVEEKRQQQSIDRERILSIVRQHTLERRNARLAYVIDSSDWDFLEEDINTRLSLLAGLGIDPKQIVETASRLKRKKENLYSALEAYYLNSPDQKNPALTCNKTSKIDLDKFSVKDQQFVMSYIRQCEDYLGLIDNLNSFGGELGKLNTDIIEISRFQGELKQKIQALNKELKEAIKDLKANPQGIDEIIKIISEFDNVDKIQEALEGFGFKNLALIGIINELNAKQDIIENILIAFKDGDGAEVANDPNAKPYIQIASSFGEFIKQISQNPNQGVLTLQKEALRLRVQGLRSQLSNAQKRFSLLESKRNAMFLEIQSLVQTKKFFDFLGNCKGTIKEKFAHGCSEKISRVLIHYANSWSVGRLEQEETDYEIIALRHKAVIDNSENALEQWENLITIPIISLAALHNSGITPDTIARFLQAAVTAGGLTFIGIGVN